MQSEIIIMDGITFRRYPNSKRRDLAVYFISSSKKFFGHKAKRLHRYIWEKHNGNIPKGCHIHHKDFNPVNNDLDNLECLSSIEHHKRHYESWKPRFAKFAKAGQIAASKWSHTTEGKKFRKKWGKKNSKYFPRYKIKRNCNQCDKAYIAKTK